jgi:hypothetical protein
VEYHHGVCRFDVMGRSMSSEQLLHFDDDENDGSQRNRTDPLLSGERLGSAQALQDSPLRGSRFESKLLITSSTPSAYHLESELGSEPAMAATLPWGMQVYAGVLRLEGRRCESLFASRSTAA